MRSRNFLAASVAILLMIGCWHKATVKPVEKPAIEQQSQSESRPSRIMRSGGGSSGGGGGGGTPGGSNTQIQYNNAGAFGGISGATTDGTTLSVTKLAVSGLTGATAASRYVGATTSGAPVSGTFAVGDFCIDQTGKTFVCTTLGTPGAWTQTGSVYTLPTATASVLGGVKPDGTSVVNTAGAISVTTTSIGAAPTASPTFTGQATFNTVGYSSVYSIGSIGGGTTTINWGTNGNLQKCTLTGNQTLAFTAPTNPGFLTLIVTQDGTGGRVVTWPTMKWSGAVAGVVTTTASATDVVSMFFDGTNYYGAISIPDAR